MAGTLVSDTIQSSLSTPTVFKNTSGVEIGQLCKAWCDFGPTPTIRASFNTSSITKPSTGTYTITFTNAFTDGNYLAPHGLLSDTSWGSIARSGDAGGAAPNIKTTTQMYFQTVSKSANATADINDQGVVVFR